MRRSGIPYLTVVLICAFFLSWFLLPTSPPPTQRLTWPSEGKTPIPVGQLPDELLHGNGIMPKLGNETLKAELGRASWKLFHTILARYPQKPTHDERDALKSYVYLFARLYPCGECGEHFRGLLAKYPPQTSSRDAASQWGCFVHNQVNERLGKPDFDCTTVTDTYKCGCADAEEEEGGGLKLPPGEDLLGPLPTPKKPTGSSNSGDGILEDSTNPELRGVHLEVEGLVGG
ncbi:ERV/ALR sulfhydryl oxidase domain-containing protein [Kalaharituber pfeilii]|nr:ERV/ALR sulfhydryl oxidase domain-containing protein [Kalaharituber pfeilii]